VRYAECPPEAVLSADPESFYAPTDDNALCELVLDLGGEVKFNTVSVREVIELSHRVTGFEISAEVGGEWKLLCWGECIGNRFATRFDEVSATRVKFKVTSALAAPLIREIALYSFKPLRDKARENKEKTDLISAPDTKITETADEYEILLG
jgi:alpha-L-fucosidase